MALTLARHNERAPDVAILNESLAILNTQPISKFECRGATRIRNRDDNVDIMIGLLGEQFIGKLLTHTQSCFIDGNTVH